jgi:hypothetical protein
MTREEALTSMETFRYHIDLPEDESGLPDWIKYDLGAWTIALPYKALLSYLTRYGSGTMSLTKN